MIMSDRFCYEIFVLLCEFNYFIYLFHVIYNDIINLSVSHIAFGSSKYNKKNRYEMFHNCSHVVSRYKS